MGASRQLHRPPLSERAGVQALGYEVITFIRTPGEMTAVAESDPFPGMVEEEHTLSVAFLKQHPGKPVADRLHAMRTDYDELLVHGRELYWLARGRMSMRRSFIEPARSPAAPK